MAYQDLVEEILNELLFQRTGGEESMEVGSQEFRDEIAAAIVRIKKKQGSLVRTRSRQNFLHILERRNENITETDYLLIVSIAVRRMAGRLLVGGFG